MVMLRRLCRLCKRRKRSSAFSGPTRKVCLCCDAGQSKKMCSDCGKMKRLSEFHRKSTKYTTYRRWCRKCHGARAMIKRRAIFPNDGRTTALTRLHGFKEWRKIYATLYRYGITYESYMSMVEGQGNLCAVCKKRCVTGRRLCLDHDHVSGRPRGLVCTQCNSGIGFFRDNPELLRRAAEYLESYSVGAVATTNS